MKALAAASASTTTLSPNNDPALLSLAENGSAREQDSWARPVRYGRHRKRRNRRGERRPHRRSKNSPRKDHAAAWAGGNSDRRRFIHSAGNRRRARVVDLVFESLVQRESWHSRRDHVRGHARH